MISRLSVLLATCNTMGGVYFFSRKKDPLDDATATPDRESFLCKFVMDGTGKKIGESISVDQDVLIIKSGPQFLGVPLKHIETSEKILVVKGLFDVTKALEMGEKWRKESYRDMNKNVTGDERKRRV